MKYKLKLKHNRKRFSESSARDELLRLQLQLKKLDQQMDRYKNPEKYLIPELIQNTSREGYKAMGMDKIVRDFASRYFNKTKSSPKGSLKEKLDKYNIAYQNTGNFVKDFENLQKQIRHAVNKKANSRINAFKDYVKGALRSDDIDNMTGLNYILSHSKYSKKPLDLEITDNGDTTFGPWYWGKKVSDKYGYANVLKHQARREIDGEHAEDFTNLYKNPDKINAIDAFSGIGKKIIPGISTVLGRIPSISAHNSGYTPPNPFIPKPIDLELDSDPIDNTFNRKDTYKK